MTGLWVSLAVLLEPVFILGTAIVIRRLDAEPGNAACVGWGVIWPLVWAFGILAGAVYAGILTGEQIGRLARMCGPLNPADFVGRFADAETRERMAQRKAHAEGTIRLKR
jgi:hypothetical protein